MGIHSSSSLSIGTELSVEESVPSSPEESVTQLQKGDPGPNPRLVGLQCP